MIMCLFQLHVLLLLLLWLGLTGYHDLFCGKNPTGENQGEIWHRIWPTACYGFLTTSDHWRRAIQKSFVNGSKSFEKWLISRKTLNSTTERESKIYCDSLILRIRVVFISMYFAKCWALGYTCLCSPCVSPTGGFFQVYCVALFHCDRGRAKEVVGPGGFSHDPEMISSLWQSCVWENANKKGGQSGFFGVELRLMHYFCNLMRFGMCTWSKSTSGPPEMAFHFKLNC